MSQRLSQNLLFSCWVLFKFKLLNVLWRMFFVVFYLPCKLHKNDCDDVCLSVSSSPYPLEIISLLLDGFNLHRCFDFTGFKKFLFYSCLYWIWLKDFEGCIPFYKMDLPYTVFKNRGSWYGWHCKYPIYIYIWEYPYIRGLFLFILFYAFNVIKVNLTIYSIFVLIMTVLKNKLKFILSINNFVFTFYTYSLFSFKWLYFFSICF